MSIPIITRNNTVDEWRIQTNQSSTNLNDLKSGNYTKIGGQLNLTGNTTLSITSSGTSLQVSNNALFQSNVTIERDVSIGVVPAQTGNVSIGNKLVVFGEGSGLEVSNNALINVDLQVVGTIYTGNVRANGNLTVNQNATVNGIVRVENSGETFFINTGSAFINTVSSLDSTTTNAQISNAVIGFESVNFSQINLISSNTALINVLQVNTSVDIGSTLNVSDDTFVDGNLSITGNTSSNNIVNNGHINTITIRTTGDMNVGSRLEVIGNTTTGNISVSNAVFANTIVTSDRVDIFGPLRVRQGAIFEDRVDVDGAMGVFGDFEIKGNLIYDTDILTISANVPVTTGSAFIGVNRGNTSGVLGTVNANAYIKWSGFDNEFQIRDVFNTNNATSYSKILTANLISSSLTSTSIETIASSSAANSLNTSIVVANTAMRQYVDANVAILGQRVNGANLAIVAANTAMKQYVDANVSIVNQRAVTSGVYANAAFTIANTAVTNSSSAGSYANSAFARANNSPTNDGTGAFGTYGISVTGNSGTATALQTARNINGTSFNGTAAITTANWGTARNITIGNTTRSVNGSVNATWTLGDIGANNASNLTTGTVDNARLTGTYSISVTGNSGTSAALQTARTINGTLFNGTASITTANWGPARDLTIGNTTRSVNGSVNAAWTLGDIGANDASNLTTGILPTARLSGTYSIGVTGNSGTATALATGRVINGTTFNGTVNITTANWGTARNITIGNTTRSVNGSVNASWTLGEIGAAATSQTMHIGTTAVSINRTSAAQTLTGVSIDGSSASSTTATRLATARTINGTSFNGTANIVTANWGPARTLWGNSINGSGDVTAPLRPAAGSRGAPAFSQSGDTASGIYFPVANQVAISTGNQDAIICQIQTVHLGGSTVIPGGATTGMSFISSGRRFIQSNNLSFSNSDMNRQSSGAFFNFLHQASIVGGITTTGSDTAFVTTSDYRLKVNVKPIEKALDKVARLKPVTFDWKSTGKSSEGFIAHELQQVCPSAVIGKKDEVDAEGKPVYQGVDSSFLVATLAKAIQELKSELDNVKSELNLLKKG